MNKVIRLIKGLKLTAVDFFEYFSNASYKKELAANPLHDDVYIVSFPKSGATWMDFLLANTNLSMSRSIRTVTYYNVQQLIPDVFDTDLSPLDFPFPGFRFIKSHSDYNPFYKNVIYVVRDPRDVLISYFYFLRDLGQHSGTLSELIRSKKYGILAWKNHVLGWLDQSPVSLPFMMVRYEDLKSKCESEISRLYGQLGFSIPEEVLKKTTELSSFSNMKALEKSLNYGGRPIGEKFQFMRKGTSGDGKLEISKADNDFILQQAGDILKRLGYL
jgi:hypothetical protein